MSRTKKLLLGLAALALVAAGATGHFLRSRAESRDLVKVGGMKNACCCTHRIEPEDP